MSKPKLDLRTKLDYMRGGWHGPTIQVEVGEVIMSLLKLQQNHPNGFVARLAHTHLTSVFGKLCENSYAINKSRLFNAMAESGYAERSIPQGSPKGVQYTYKIKPGALKDYSHPRYISKDGAINQPTLPKDLVLLINGISELNETSPDETARKYFKSEGVNPNQIARSLLERAIVRDVATVAQMRRLKSSSPEKYATMGGHYLDKLVEIK